MCTHVLRVQRDDTKAAPEPIPVMGRNRVPELIIITPDEPSWSLLALPHLLHTVTTAQDPRGDIADYHTCALALVATTPPDQLLPDPTDAAPTSTIGQAATRALRRQSCAEHTDVPFPRTPPPYEDSRTPPAINT